MLLFSYPLAFLSAIPAATAKQQQAQEERPLHPGQKFRNLVEGFFSSSNIMNWLNTWAPGGSKAPASSRLPLAPGEKL